MNISLPDSLKHFAQERANSIRALTRADKQNAADEQLEQA